jgi:hypothetical protein
MTAQRDPDRLIHAILMEGSEQLQDQIYDAVRAEIERKRQRAVFGPWRMPDMNKLVPIGLGAAAVVVALVIGAQLLPRAPGGVGGAPSAVPTAPPSPTPVGGTVEYVSDEGPSTTNVDATAVGTSVSGTAVSTSAMASHTVALECAVRDGDTWAFGGTTAKTTVPGERAGEWSAVFVRDGTPQLIAIWLSDAKVEGVDCDGWLGGQDMAGVDDSNFTPVKSGALVPPPDLAP